MNPLRLFISSVQREFAQERTTLRDYLQNDPLMRRFFDVFLFEDTPASDRRPDELYLDEVDRCDLYVGLFGLEYGMENEQGLSPTEQEFERASAVGAHRLIFVKGADDGARHPRMQSLIRKAQSGLIRKRFNSSEELVSGLYAALVEFLEGKALIRREPFDAAPCENAGLPDLDFAWITRFIRTARRVRKFPLTEESTPQELLEHLNLMKHGRLTNAAMLLFGRTPQRFLISSEIKCAHFHGKEVAKPIPSYQVYKGTAFQLVDQAVDFVLSKLSLSVGTRSQSVQAPVTYEIPKEVVTEAIVNAVAHRDYTNNGSVQVMLFSDRLEVWNPGRLPVPLNLENLREPHASVPSNPLIAESLYLAEYIERMGTGTLDMIRRCAEVGLPEPGFSDTGQFVTTVWRSSVVTVCCDGEPISDVAVLALLPNGTWKQAKTNEAGEALLETETRSLPLSIFVAAKGFAAHVERSWTPAERPLFLELRRVDGGGAAIFPESTGQLPGLKGHLRPTRDTQGRIYLDAGDISINDGQPQPVQCSLGEDLHLMDSNSADLVVRIVDIVGQSALVEYRASQGQDKRKPESRLELWSDSQLESRVIRLLSNAPMSKAELSMNLGQKRISASLHQVARHLLAEGLIEYTMPDRPRSRLQQYRLTDMGKELESRLKSRLKSPDKSQLESELESQLESEPESRSGLRMDSRLESRVVRLLSGAPMSKAELSLNLGQKRISASLHQVVRHLLGEGLIEQTKPDRPRSRLQQYRLTDMGKELESRLKSRLKSPDKSQLESELESQLESEPESRSGLRMDSRLESRVVRLLSGAPMSKAELSLNLGQKRISASLHQVVRHLLGEGLIEQTKPDRPRSRLQQYRLTDMGVQLESRLKSPVKSLHKSPDKSQLESQLESADPKARGLVAGRPTSKLDHSRDLRQEDVSGRLNEALRPLPTGGTIEQMVPDQASDQPPEHRLTATTTRERPESQAESIPRPTPESQPESLDAKVLSLLASKPMSKADLSRNLGQKEVSGQLNKVVRSLLADGLIEYTVPDKPQSRLQKYRLTAKGVAGVANAKTARVEP